jgi:hypothetical protein
VPGDHDLYLAGIADDNHECLRLLLFHAADVAQLARMALGAPVSLNDAEGVRLLLEAGADPNRYADDADPLSPVIYAAIRSGCSAELTGLLLGYGADPHIPGPDGRSSYVLADCREWALSGRHLLGTIVGAICRGVCARQAIGARKHALVMRRRQDSNCGCAFSGHVGRRSLDVTSRRWVMSNTTHVSGIPGNPSQMR